MTLTLYWYPNCSTCRKAKKWLEEAGHELELVHLVEETPSEEVLRDLIEKSGLDKLPDATLEEKLCYLASNGMLIKRPIVTDGEKVTVGFKEDTYENTWK